MKTATAITATTMSATAVAITVPSGALWARSRRSFGAGRTLGEQSVPFNLPIVKTYVRSRDSMDSTFPHDRLDCFLCPTLPPT